MYPFWNTSLRLIVCVVGIMYTSELNLKHVFSFEIITWESFLNYGSISPSVDISADWNCHHFMHLSVIPFKNDVLELFNISSEIWWTDAKWNEGYRIWNDHIWSTFVHCPWLCNLPWQVPIRSCVRLTIYRLRGINHDRRIIFSICIMELNSLFFWCWPSNWPVILCKFPYL